MTGRTPREVQAKSTEQLLRWHQEEERARERAAVADLKERAELATEDALARKRSTAASSRPPWPWTTASTGPTSKTVTHYLGPPTPEEVAAQMSVPEREP